MADVLPQSANLILPALVTPLTPQGTLDEPSAERLIEHLYERGVGGLYVNGSTGEGVNLDFATRRRLAELAVDLSRNRGLAIIHVAAVQAAEAYQLAAHAARIGAAGIASIPPFVGGYQWDEIVDYYRRLVEASGLPVVAYYIPRITGQEFTLEQLVQLIEIPGVAGLKFTEPNMYLLERIVGRMRKGQVMFHGPDQVLALGLAMGAHGGIGTSYNFLPKLILAVAQHVAAGRLAEAIVVQKQVNDVIEVLLRYPTLAATKQILYWQGLIDNADCVTPRAALSSDHQTQLRRQLMRTSIAESLVR